MVLEILLETKRKELNDIRLSEEPLQQLQNMKRIQLNTQSNDYLRTNQPSTQSNTQSNKYHGTYNGLYHNSIMLGNKTNNFEHVRLEKKYEPYSEMVSDFITTKNIKGIELINNWTDGTNGRIKIESGDGYTKIKCVSQIQRGHSWDVNIYT
jgi:hypothetical protein